MWYFVEWIDGGWKPHWLRWKRDVETLTPASVINADFWDVLPFSLAGSNICIRTCGLHVHRRRDLQSVGEILASKLASHFDCVERGPRFTRKNAAVVPSLSNPLPAGVYSINRLSAIPPFADICSARLARHWIQRKEEEIPEDGGSTLLRNCCPTYQTAANRPTRPKRFLTEALRKPQIHLQHYIQNN
jgi:hypothetical protein